MERTRRASRLIIVCGLPGAGKTTLAKQLEGERGAVRLEPDEWMDALAIDLWDGAQRGQVEALQWQVARRLLALGLTVVIEWGTWGRSERDTLRTEARALGATVELHYLSAPVVDAGVREGAAHGQDAHAAGLALSLHGYGSRPRGQSYRIDAAGPRSAFEGG